MKILNYREINSGIVIAGFDVTIEEWGVTFKKCTHFKSNDKEWIGFPSNKFTDAQGQSKYAPFIFMEKDRKSRFDFKVLEMLRLGEYEKAKKFEQTEMSLKSMSDEECPF